MKDIITPLSPSSLIPDSELNPAKWAYERIAKSIIAFEKELDPDEEVGARLVSFGGNEVIHIDDLGYWGPDFVKFYGRTSDDRNVELIQHISQVSVMLVAVKTEDESAKRIGFVLSEKLKKEDD